jgi:plasmid stability protein
MPLADSGDGVLVRELDQRVGDAMRGWARRHLRSLDAVPERRARLVAAKRTESRPMEIAITARYVDVVAHAPLLF